MRNIVFNQDAIQGMKDHIPDNSIDLIATDPPYGISAEMFGDQYNRDSQYVVPGYVEVEQEKYEQFSHDWISECARVLRPGGSMYIVSGTTNAFFIEKALRATDLIIVNKCIWKYNFGLTCSKKFVASHYEIFFVQKKETKTEKAVFHKFALHKELKGASTSAYADIEDVWMINKENKPGELKNINELPMKVYEKMIRLSSNVGDIVLDPFMGGHTCVVVSKMLQRDYVGFEINEHAYNAFSEIANDVPVYGNPPPVSNHESSLWACERYQGKCTRRWDSFKNSDIFCW